MAVLTPTDRMIAHVRSALRRVRDVRQAADDRGFPNWTAIETENRLTKLLAYLKGRALQCGPSR